MTGKEKCRILKELRAKLAEENGITGFEYKECPYDGECTGTCPACEQEVYDLANALDKICKKDNFDLRNKEDQTNNLMDLLDDKWLGGLELRTRDDIKLMGEVSVDYFKPSRLCGKARRPDFVDTHTPLTDPDQAIIHAAQGAESVYKLLHEFEASDKCGSVEITRFDENGADIESFELNPETRAQRLAERDRMINKTKEETQIMGAMELIPNETLQKRKQYDELMTITIIEYPNSSKNTNKDELTNNPAKKPRGIFGLFGKDKK